MSTIVVPVASQGSVVVPDNLEDADQASLLEFVQPLANMDAWLKSVIYRSPRVIPLAGYSSTTTTSDLFLGASPPGNRFVTFANNSVAWINRILLPDYATLTAVNAVVRHGNAGAGGQMSMQIYRRQRTGSSTGTVLQLGSTHTFTAGATFHDEAVTISSNNVIDNTQYEYFAQVNPSSLAATISDQLWDLYATMSAP